MIYLPPPAHRQFGLPRGPEGDRQCVRTETFVLSEEWTHGIRLSAEFSEDWLESIGHPNQLGIGSRAHFVHGRTSMNFDGNFADPEVAGDLLVHLAGRDEQHHFLLARRKRFEALFQLQIVVLDDPSLSIALDGGQDGIEHVLIAKRLGKEIDGAMLHGVDRHRNVSVSGHHHHRNSDADLDQPGLKLEAVHIGQSDVEDDAARPVREIYQRKSFAVA